MNLANTPEVSDAIKAWFDEAIAGLNHSNVTQNGWTLHHDGILTFSASVQVTSKQLQQLRTLTIADRETNT